MNTIYKSILILGAGVISLNALAQQEDSTLTRQVYLEREYNPTLNEATKINTSPNIFSPRVQSPRDVKFLEAAPELTVNSNKLGQVASGDIRTNVPFTNQRFYLKAGAGSHGNIDGALGVRAVDTKNDKLDIVAGYNAANGEIKYAHPTSFLEKVKAKYSDLKIGVNYLHNFEPSTFTIGGSYQNMGYNYYGSSFSPNATIDNIDLETKQKVDIVSFNAGLKSSEANEGLLKYEANLSYSGFKSKYGYLPTIDKGPRGGIVAGDVNFYTALGEGNIGIAGSVLNQSFTGKKDYDNDTESNFKGFTNLTANPYFKIEDINWDLNLGLNASYVFDNKNKFVITPNITAQIHISEVNTLYAGITGGVDNNTFIDVLQENRYANPSGRVAYSRTPFDINAGFKSGVIPNFEFEIFGGYKQTENDHTYIAYSFIDLSPTGNIVAWSNLGDPVYNKISTGHFGGQIKTKLIPMTTLSARAIGYFYTVKDGETRGAETLNKAWGRPKFTFDLTADIKPVDKLTLSLQYLLMTGRKGFAYSLSADLSQLSGDDPVLLPSPNIQEHFTEMNMKNISELNAYAEYEIVKFFSVHARINNIFNQKYEQQFGYTLQGFNVLGGIGLKF